MTDAPSPFSAVIPGLQIVWDATSWNALQFCPRYYQLSIIEGWRGSKVEFEFGALYAKACEVFKKARAAGHDCKDATIQALRCALEISWSETSGPWGGRYEDVWHCTGAMPYKNAKGNAAKCPWSHKGKWFPGPMPSQTCGSCGAPLESENHWIPEDKYRNRETLIRLVVWYCLDQSENGGPFRPIVLGGVPLVEKSARMPTPFVAGTGERFWMSGYWDSVVRWGEPAPGYGENFIADNKTTTKSLNDEHWAKFSPNTQVDMYDLMGATLLKELDIKGVMLEGAQILVGGAKFAPNILYRNTAQREELLKDFQTWMQTAEFYAKNGYWPMARAQCWGCALKKICALSPENRRAFLEANLKVEKWNPLAER